MNKNKLKKYISVLCLGALLVSMFASCKKETPQSGDRTDTTVENTEKTEETEAQTQKPDKDDDFIDLIIDGVPQFKKIIHAEKAIDGELEAARKIYAALREIDSDFSIDDDRTYKKDSKEIVVGISTAYPETKKVAKELKYKDYAIIVCENKLIVTAQQEEALRNAANNLVKQILSRVTVDSTTNKKSLSVPQGIYNGKYKFDELKICGKEISDFTVIYPSSPKEFKTEDYKEVADKFAGCIGEAYGKLPSVVDDSVKESANEIIFGDSNRSKPQNVRDEKLNPLEFRVRAEGGKLYINYGGLYSAEKSAEILLKELQKQGRKADVKEGSDIKVPMITSKEFVKADKSDIRIMGSNILADIPSWGGCSIAKRVEIFAGNIRFLKPDAVGMQEATSNWVKTLPKYLGGDYTVLSYKRDDNVDNYSCLIYNNKTLEKLSNGVDVYSTTDNKWCRNMGWGEFKVKSTGKEFVLISTHLDLPSRSSRTIQGKELAQRMKELSKGGSRSVISVGDFNSARTEPAYKEIIDTGMKDMKVVTEKLYNDVPTWKGGVGVAALPTNGTIDYVFATPDTSCKFFMTVISNFTVDMSDHNSNLADLSIS